MSRNNSRREKQFVNEAMTDAYDEHKRDQSADTAHKLCYSDVNHSENFLQIKKKTAGAYKTMSAADRGYTDRKTNAAVPSDSAVEELRDWSTENRQ